MDSDAAAPDNRVSRIKESGNACVKAGKFDGAVKCYTDALELADNRSAGDPAQSWALSANARAVLHANRSFANISIQGTDDLAWDCTQAALADARMAVQIDPGYPKGHFRLGQALKALGDTTAASQAFAACKQLQQDQAQAAKAKAAKAAKEAPAAPAPAPAGASTRELFSAGQAMEDSGDYAGAEAAYHAAVAADATHCAAHCALAGLKMAVRADYPGAIASYQAAIALEPVQSTEVYSNLCGMLAMGKDFEGAEKAARCLIKLLPPGDAEGSECLERVLAEREKATDEMYANVM